MDTDAGEVRLKLLTALGDGLWKLRLSGILCDVTVVADGVTFLCHKAVLCAVSPYFTAMFTNDMKESRDSMVTLHEVKAELFGTILECIYRGVDIVTEDNVQDIMEIASSMLINTIFEQCESHFSRKLSLSNFIDILYIAKKYNCDKLEGLVWTFMLKNFSKVCESEDMALLPLDILSALLRDDNLNVESEDIVCEAALKWLSGDLENRKAHGPDLFTSLRIPMCSSEYILGNLCQNETFKVIQCSQEMLQEAFVYHMCPAKKSAFPAVQMTHRASSIQNDVFVIMGGADTSDYTGSGMRCYSFLGRTWYQLPSLPENIGPYYAACSFGDDIYVSGGQYNREVFYIFQAATCTWISLPKMPTGRYQHAMTAVSDIIYTLGGDGVNSKFIEGYQVNDAGWGKYGELLGPVSHAVAAVCKHTLLVFGGNHELSQTVQRFDTKTKQVTRVDTMSLPGLGSRVVANGNVNYVIASDGQVFVTSDEKASIVGKIENFNEEKFGVTQYRGSFYIVSGTKAGLKRPDVSKIRVVNHMTLNVAENISVPPTPGRLPWLFNRTRLACCRISISKRFLKGKEIHVPEPQT